MDLDSTLCYCFHIKKRKIVNYVRQTRPRRASQISDCFGAGTGCGWCVPFLKKIHQEVMAGKTITSDDISAAEYEALRSAYREDVREGTRHRNSYATAEIPAELAATAESGDVPRADETGKSVDTVAERSQPTEESPPPAPAGESDDWDVSDYFSRQRPPEPDPEELK